MSTLLFNSGTTSLLTVTREYAGDPSGGPQTLWSIQLVKDAINLSLTEMRADAGLLDVGDAVKRTYADTVADQIFYAKPADFERVITIEIETGGQDLTSVSVSSATITYLEPKEEELALRMHNTGEISAPKYMFIHDQHFGVVSPLATGKTGTNSFRLTYRASSSDLSGDTDEPDVPRNHQELICLKAAMRLKMSRDLDFRDLIPFHNKMADLYKKSVHDQMADYEGQFAVAGLGNKAMATLFGRINHP